MDQSQEENLEKLLSETKEIIETCLPPIGKLQEQLIYNVIYKSYLIAANKEMKEMNE